MTKERVCANDASQPVEPVTHHENSEAKGHALCGEDIFREHIEKTQALRERQATYHATLPTDPTEVIHAAARIMHESGDGYPEGIEEALHLSRALRAMIMDGDVDENGGNREAALYAADRIVAAMDLATRRLDRISDILANPGRIERDQAN